MKIYLDNAATTRPTIQAISAANLAMEEEWFNPSTLYDRGINVSNHLARIRQNFTSYFNARDTIFTSGGTEANNLAIYSSKRQKAHFICSQIEHSSVYETFMSLRSRGYDVDFIPPSDDFSVDPQDVISALRPNTALVSIMHVNSETGAVNDIASIGKAIRRHNSHTLFHSDGVQAFLKQSPEPVAFTDMYSISAHKIGALKGTGALIINLSNQLKPQITGGSQENGMRAGTENTAGIFAFNAAFNTWYQNASGFSFHLDMLTDKLIRGFESINGCVLNLPKNHSSHILNVSFLGIKGETMLHVLEDKGIYVGIGSACSSKKGPSRILAAQGFNDERLNGAVRISLCPYNTIADIDIALEEMDLAYRYLRNFKRR